ncbi:hypothetical protein N7454_004513 [Penicillium verhagenii]|nr:hypothetical protein N7454_004513 [Penicillium verhagenii]
MGKKRKRPSKVCGPTSSQTSITAATGRFKSSKDSAARNNHTTHPVISLYYHQVLTLRQYILSQLPLSSKSRRKRIKSLRSSPDRSNVQPLIDLLDSTLVGILKLPSPNVGSEWKRAFREFTQSQSRSVLVSTDTGPTSPQSEVVDFVISQLFKQSSKPQHLLTHGFQRSFQGNDDLQTKIPGIVVQFHNENVAILQQSPWTEVLDLLGGNGDEIMLRLLFDCGIFAPIDASRAIYSQLSDLVKNPPSQSREKKPAQKTKRLDRKGEIRNPNSIVFLRRSMLYSRHASWSNGKLVAGLGRARKFQIPQKVFGPGILLIVWIDVLNRFKNLDSTAQTIHVMMYIFARQFGLRSVFVPTEDRNEQFLSHGHAFREDEIFARDDGAKASQAASRPSCRAYTAASNPSGSLLI